MGTSRSHMTLLRTHNWNPAHIVELIEISGVAFPICTWLFLYVLGFSYNVLGIYFPLSLERGVYSKKLKLFIFSQHSVVGRRQTLALSMGCLSLPTRLQLGSFQPPFPFLCPLEKEQMTNISYPFAALGLSKASLKLHCMNYSFSLLFQNPDLLQIPSISSGGKRKTDAHFRTLPPSYKRIPQFFPSPLASSLICSSSLYSPVCLLS